MQGHVCIDSGVRTSAIHAALMRRNMHKQQLTFITLFLKAQTSQNVYMIIMVKDDEDNDYLLLFPWTFFSDKRNVMAVVIDT